MINSLKYHKLILLAPLAIVLIYLAFENNAVFWYMYTFSVLVLMAMALAFGRVRDEMETWKALVYGLGFGTLLYGLIAGGFHLLSLFPLGAAASVSGFMGTFAPASIWHYLLLLFIIVPGEEIFWRGFVQQEMKKYMKPLPAVAVTSILFGLALAFSGFWTGAIAGAVTGLLLGWLYEWKRSMPSVIIAHLVMLILLFLVMPLPV